MVRSRAPARVRRAPGSDARNVNYDALPVGVCVVSNQTLPAGDIRSYATRGRHIVQSYKYDSLLYKTEPQS